MSPRQTFLYLALAVTVLLSIWAVTEDADDDAVQAAPRPPRPAVDKPAVGQASPVAAYTAAPREGFASGNLFPMQSWRPPSPPPSMVSPPPKAPPPLPFSYVGKWREDGKEVLFLAEGNRVLSVSQGDVHDGWRVDEIKDDAMIFTYLPMEMQQTLRIGQ